jgi:superfamily II DNA or RNA helicase
LRLPTDEQLGSVGAARIDFNPFQYRPVLRLLRADQPRLLIADDVGVGKTIEAGLILKELVFRRPLDRVLIACPKSLTSKWHLEMRNKFDEQFRVLDSDTLKHCLQETQLDGVWPEEFRRCIVHYEVLRLDRYLHGRDTRRGRAAGLRELDPPPYFDLVIADEAHHLRNPASNVHRAAEFLAEQSEALVLLTATPIQLRHRDLHTLVRLLRPELYPDLASLQEALEPNKYLTRAIKALRSSPDDAHLRAELAGNLEAAVQTKYGRSTIGDDQRFRRLRSRLAEQTPLETTERVHAARTIEELHSLAYLMNRTRRRDITRFTVRQPMTRTVQFTAGQRAAYDRLLEIRAEQLRAEHSTVVTKLLLDNLERQASSCLPALLRALSNGQAQVRLEDFADTPEDWDGDLDEDILTRLSRHPLHGHPEIAQLAATAAGPDPKFDELRQVVASALGSDGPGKVLVFSFFLHTLAYLKSRLEDAGVRVGLVSGQVEEQDRQALRDRFALPRTDPSAIDVLLSSEVGCEGLDYQFCDRLINYDIPWNPMRVEQRIGRIDRYGQRADKVMIYNFVTPGTVEERVWQRCYDRLGLFVDAIGDLDGVLGDLVERLTEISLNPALTPAQQEERARQETENAERKLAEQAALEDASHELLGWDASLTDDVTALRQPGMSVGPAQILALLRRFFAVDDINATVSGDEDKILQVRAPKAVRAALAQRLRSFPTGRISASLREWLTGEGQVYRCTAEASIATAQSVDLLAGDHPLLQLAVATMAPVDGEELTLHATLTDTDLPVGRYTFIWEIWRTHAIRPRTWTVALAADDQSGAPAPAVEARLLAVLSGAAGRLHELEPGAAAWSAVEARAERLRREERTRAEADNTVHLARRREAWTSLYERQLASVQAVQDKVVDENARRMNRGKIDRLEAEHARRLIEFADRAAVDVFRRRLARGVIEVRGE